MQNEYYFPELEKVSPGLSDLFNRCMNNMEDLGQELRENDPDRKIKDAGNRAKGELAGEPVKPKPEPSKEELDAAYERFLKRNRKERS